jgi:adenosylmethionine-8-amino-7-oxononanoate aminotransferase
MTSTDLGVDRAQRLRSLTRRVMVDFNQMKTFTRDPLIIVDGKGVRLTDVDGKSYIDGLSGVFAVSLGHGNEAIIDAIAEQHRRVSFSSPIMSTTDRALELAAELVRISGDRVEVVKQLGSGSEATEAAIKMARQYHRQTGSAERYKTISFYRSYHGATMGSLSATGWPQLRNPYEPLVHGGLHVMPPTPGRCRFCAPGGECSLGCLANLRDTIELEGPGTVSAVIVEPVMLTAGVYVQSPAFFSELRRICDEFGVVLIFDEIVTGFGRLGEWFGSEVYDIKPDLVTCAKGLSSAYASIGAVIAADRVVEPFLGDGASEPSSTQAADARAGAATSTFTHGITFGGHPVQSAIALKNIEIMKRERVVENVRENGEDFRATLSQLLDLPIVGDLRGTGFFYALELVKDKETRETFSDEECETLLRGFLSPALFDKGLICRADDRGDPVVQISPPLIATQKEFDEIAGTLGDVLSEAWQRIT